VLELIDGIYRVTKSKPNYKILNKRENQLTQLKN